MHDRLTEALRSGDPTTSLSEAVRMLVAQGHKRATLYTELEQLRESLAATGRESEEDAVLDVMDFLSGFCSPHMRI
jgi:hypothetical protein